MAHFCLCQMDILGPNKPARPGRLDKPCKPGMSSNQGRPGRTGKPSTPGMPGRLGKPGRPVRPGTPIRLGRPSSQAGGETIIFVDQEGRPPLKPLCL